MRAALDAALGRVTMYRLVLVVLLVLAVVAGIEGAVGLVSFSPLAILVSLVLAAAISWGSNRVFAALWRVRPHTESSLVTGLLVFCLFFPGLDMRSLGAVAIAAVAANLSKYVLAWRGRHVFNPIAVGAVVVTLTAVSGATWWVATPALLPVIVLGGALVLYRTGTWDIALLVVLITVAGTTARSMAVGTAVLPALWTAVASYPFLFFAAFMVTEPLTLPPRRWQRLLEGAVIGGVALVPLHLGPLVMAPELALLVGNLVAFPFGPRRRVRMTLERSATHAGGIADLWFRPEAPLRIRSGQYVELTLPHRGQDARGARRVFSIANRPDGELLRVATRWAEPGSSFKRRLAALPQGAVVDGSAVGGDFLLPADPAVPMLWIAGGIGITPFASFADDLAGRGERRDVVLVHAVRMRGELALDDVFDTAGIPVVVVGPSELADDLPPSWRYGGRSLRDPEWIAAIEGAAGRTAFVAGSPGLVAAARTAAKRAGVRRIHRDRFLGY
jgi:ferredoxin-NADP reductase